MSHTRQDWLSAQESIAAIEAERKKLLAPTDDRYRAACERLEEIEEDLPEMMSRCEGCSDPIFDDDPHMGESESGIFTCKDCSPTWQDMLDSHSDWNSNTTGEPMTRAEAEAWAKSYTDKGGDLADSMAT